MDSTAVHHRVATLLAPTSFSPAFHGPPLAKVLPCPTPDEKPEKDNEKP